MRLTRSFLALAFLAPTGAAHAQTQQFKGTNMQPNTLAPAALVQQPANTMLGNCSSALGNVAACTAAQAKATLVLDQVNNTTDAAKPVSTATSTALALKANLAGATFTGTVSGPTPTAGDSTTKLATTAYVQNAVTAATAGVSSVNTRTGAITLTSTDVGLANANNTSDANKPVSTATQTQLDGKQPLDADLTSLAALAGQTTYGRSLLTLANKAALQTAVGVTLPVAVTASRTLTNADSGQILVATSAITLTIPTGLTLPFSTAVRIAPGGSVIFAVASGVTVNAAEGTVTTGNITRTRASNPGGLVVITPTTVANSYDGSGT